MSVKKSITLFSFTVRFYGGSHIRSEYWGSRFDTVFPQIIPALGRFSERVTVVGYTVCNAETHHENHSGRVTFAHGCGHHHRFHTTNSGGQMLSHAPKDWNRKIRARDELQPFPSCFDCSSPPPTSTTRELWVRRNLTRSETRLRPATPRGLI